MRHVLLPLLLLMFALTAAFPPLPQRKPSPLVRTSEDTADELEGIANALASGADADDIIARIRYAAATLRANDDPLE